MKIETELQAGSERYYGDLNGDGNDMDMETNVTASGNGTTNGNDRKKNSGLDVLGFTSRSTQRLIGPGLNVTAREIMKLMVVSGATMSGLGVKKIRKCSMDELECKQEKKVL